MMKSVFGITSLLLISLLSLKAESVNGLIPGDDFEVIYDAGGVRRIEINSSHIKVTRSIIRSPEIAEVENRQEVVRHARCGKMSPMEVRRILQVFEHNSFAYLKSFYGNMNDRKPAFRVRIFLQNHHLKKTVEFCSAPGEKCPAEFKRIENALIEFAEKKFSESLFK